MIVVYDRWYEHDPMIVWDSVTTCIRGCIEAAQGKGLGAVRVKAVGITNQRETTLAWDATTGQPLHNAIVWMDVRTAATCTKFQEQHGGPVRLALCTRVVMHTTCSGLFARHHWAAGQHLL